MTNQQGEGRPQPAGSSAPSATTAPGAPVAPSAATAPGVAVAPAPPPVSTTTVVLAGNVLWALALVVTLVVPSWHTGDRAYWPWTCAVGVVLGFLGLAYVRRGRGNAAGAR